MLGGGAQKPFLLSLLYVDLGRIIIKIFKKIL
jgi:hypothetical protein